MEISRIKIDIGKYEKSTPSYKSHKVNKIEPDPFRREPPADADDLITSNTETFGINEAYPQELQPRQRNRAASQQQIENIISNLNPALLGESALASDGSPIVGPDNVVESGNGRVMALRAMYKRGDATAEQAAKYRKFIEENAEKYGVSRGEAASMKSPVLVRERLSDVDRKQFTQDANVSNIAAMSSSETAMRDAQNMSVEMLAGLNSETDLMSNREFIKHFAQNVVPRNELGTFVDQRGQVSQDGIRRVQNAVFAKAYGDEQTLARMSEATDDNAKNISKALIQAAPAVASLQEKITKGFVKKEMSFAPHIVEAANTINSLRLNGIKVSEFLQQMNLFDDGDISPEARRILTFIDRNKQRPNVIAKFLSSIAASAENQGAANQKDLFDDGEITLDTLISEAAKRNEPAQAKQRELVFAQEGRDSEIGKSNFDYTDEKQVRDSAAKIRDDVKKQITAIGEPDDRSEYLGELMSSAMNTFAGREGVSPYEFYKDLGIKFVKGDVKGQVMLQNSYTDARGGQDTEAAEAALAAIVPRSAASVSEAANILRENGVINKPLTNNKFDITATVSFASLMKMISEKALKKSVSARIHSIAVANVDYLFENASIDVVHPDTYGRNGITRVHRMGTILKDGNDFYPVKLTVVEYTQKEQGKRIYSVEAIDVERITKSAGQLGLAQRTESEPPIADFNDKILRLLENVKRLESDQYDQAGKKGARGAINFSDTNGVTITLTPTSDVTTIIHEFGHLFRWLTERQAARFKDDAQLQADWEAIQRFGNHEKFADAAIEYAAEGKVPEHASPGLIRAFRQFKQWLVDFFNSVRGNSRIKLNDEIRGVFDRILATEEQIEAAAAENGFADIFDSFDSADSRKAPKSSSWGEHIARAKEGLLAKLMREISPENKEKRAALRASTEKVIREQVRNMPIYRAIDAVFPVLIIDHLDYRPIERLMRDKAIIHPY